MSEVLIGGLYVLVTEKVEKSRKVRMKYLVTNKTNYKKSYFFACIYTFFSFLAFVYFFFWK